MSVECLFSVIASQRRRIFYVIVCLLAITPSYRRAECTEEEEEEIHRQSGRWLSIHHPALTSSSVWPHHATSGCV